MDISYIYSVFIQNILHRLFRALRVRWYKDNSLLRSHHVHGLLQQSRQESPRPHAGAPTRGCSAVHGSSAVLRRVQLTRTRTTAQCAAGNQHRTEDSARTADVDQTQCTRRPRKLGA